MIVEPQTPAQHCQDLGELCELSPCTDTSEMLGILSQISFSPLLAADYEQAGLTCVRVSLQSHFLTLFPLSSAGETLDVGELSSSFGNPINSCPLLEGGTDLQEWYFPA